MPLNPNFETSFAHTPATSHDHAVAIAADKVHTALKPLRKSALIEDLKFERLSVSSATADGDIYDGQIMFAMKVSASIPPHRKMMWVPVFIRSGIINDPTEFQDSSGRKYDLDPEGMKKHLGIDMSQFRQLKRMPHATMSFTDRTILPTLPARNFFSLAERIAQGPPEMAYIAEGDDDQEPPEEETPTPMAVELPEEPMPEPEPEPSPEDEAELEEALGDYFESGNSRLGGRDARGEEIQVGNMVKPVDGRPDHPGYYVAQVFGDMIEIERMDQMSMVSGSKYEIVPSGGSERYFGNRHHAYSDASSPEFDGVADGLDERWVGHEDPTTSERERDETWIDGLEGEARTANALDGDMTLVVDGEEAEPEDLTGWGVYEKIRPTPMVQMEEDFEVETMEGPMNADAGDFLAMGPEGELYPVDQEIQNQTYQEI